MFLMYLGVHTFAWRKYLLADFVDVTRKLTPREKKSNSKF